jgi:predicted histidine transporter YuiF (NhaC family)
MGMVLFRGAFEGTWYILTALSWVTLGALIKEIAAAGADSAALQAVGNVVVQADGKLGSIGTVAFIIGAACLYISFYRTRLIPRWLSGWGLVAAVPYLVHYLLRFFDIDPGLFFLVLPLAVQEMVMGLWLIVKGFSLDAVKALDAAHPLTPQPAD